MQFLKSTSLVNIAAILLVFISFDKGFSQINSPYSRYGLGDVYNSRNAATKGMGGLSSTYVDGQAVNFLNPASYSRLQTVTFDVGLEFESRTLTNQANSDKYKSGNSTFNYVALGLPLKKNKQGLSVWGMSLGLRPSTKMNYKISEDSRLAGIDSISTTYEGSGGANYAFLGTGFRIKNLSVGINAGFYFGQLDVKTQRSFINDTVSYFPSNYESQTSFNKIHVDAGLQYDIHVNPTSVVRLAATGFLGETMKGKRDVLRETIVYSVSGSFDSVDVVQHDKEIRGDIKLPVGYTVGLLYEKRGKFMIGAELEKVKWSDYRFYGESSGLANSTTLRVGGQWNPTPTLKGYFSRVTYRAGFYTGKDPLIINGSQLPVWGGSFGFGLPIRRWSSYSNQFTAINTAFEFGKRGKSNQPVTESFFKISIGLCLSDLWFNKRKFD